MIKFGIVISCYKHWQYLNAAINSVLNQDYSHFTIYLFNDDPQHPYYEPPDDSRIRYICDGQNKGLSKRLNEALSICKEDIFCVLGADDTYCPDIFRRLAFLFNLFQSIDCFYGQHYVDDKLYKQRPFDRKRLEIKNYIGAGATFYRTSAIRYVGFNEKLKRGMDYEMLLVVSKSSTPWYFPIPLFNHFPSRSVLRLDMKKNDKWTIIKRRISEKLRRRHYRC